MCNHASGQLLPEHTWNPRCAQNFSWTHVQQDIRATVARAHAKSPPLGSPSAHKAQRDVHAARPLHSHATSTLGSRSVRKETCSIERTAAFSRREHTWISLVRKREDMFMRQTAAFARHKHTWIFLRAQRDMFWQNDCCVRTPRAHLDLAPCAKRHVPSKRLLRSRAAPQDRWFLFADARFSFYTQPRTRPLRYREPVTRNPSNRTFALQIVDPISVYAVGEYITIMCPCKFVFEDVLLYECVFMLPCAYDKWVYVRNFPLHTDCVVFSMRWLGWHSTAFDFWRHWYTVSITNLTQWPTYSV